MVPVTDQATQVAMDTRRRPDEKQVTIRKAAPEDAEACGRICYEAFSAISGAHGFPCDFPSPEAAIGVFSMLFSAPGCYRVVAEAEGRIVGSNCLDERAVIGGIGPITVDPTLQNSGVGRRLMEAAMERDCERGSAGVRLVQAAFHNRSLSLYTNLGFDAREPLSCMQGRTRERSVSGCRTRKAETADLESCNALARRVHGFDRGADLGQAIENGSATVVERGGRITGYATALAFSGHATAETNTDLQGLIASAEGFGGPGILVPTRNSALFRWCLENGLRVVQPMTLMSVGLYNEPAGAWLPSILF
jgi:predicted N-acetyltransferase YhbS